MDNIAVFVTCVVAALVSIVITLSLRGFVLIYQYQRGVVFQLGKFAALRDVIGNSEMDFVLTEREQIAESIKKIVDAETTGWGVDVEAIKIQEVELPAEMKRAMAKQAEAERERRAMIIASQGELSASENLRQAAEILSASPGALHLRTLQTIRDIAADPSEKIVLFMPSSFSGVVSEIIKGE